MKSVAEVLGFPVYNGRSQLAHSLALRVRDRTGILSRRPALRQEEKDDQEPVFAGIIYELFVLDVE